MLFVNCSTINKVFIFINLYRVMPFGLCNAPATFEQLMDHVLSRMRWSRCLVYLDDVISFGTNAPEAMLRLTEVLERQSSFGLQLKAKKCTFMQTKGISVAAQPGLRLNAPGHEPVQDRRVPR